DAREPAAIRREAYVPPDHASRVRSLSDPTGGRPNRIAELADQPSVVGNVHAIEAIDGEARVPPGIVVAIDCRNGPRPVDALGVLEGCYEAVVVGNITCSAGVGPECCIPY